MVIFEESFTVPAEGLETSALFRLLQDISGHHSQSVGQGGDDLRAKGLMWVVIRHLVEIQRWPEAGEPLRLLTWPGTTRHSMCPRYYRLLDGQERCILTGCAIWAVVDRESRRMVNPAEFGVTLDTEETGLESRLPGPIRRPVTERETRFTVPAAYLDENGHMNNTRYYDLAEAVTGQRPPYREIVTEYLNEALCGQEITVRWGEAAGVCTVVGEGGAGHIFRMQLKT